MGSGNAMPEIHVTTEKFDYYLMEFYSFDLSLSEFDVAYAWEEYKEHQRSGEQLEEDPPDWFKNFSHDDLHSHTEEAMTDLLKSKKWHVNDVRDFGWVFRDVASGIGFNTQNLVFRVLGTTSIATVGILSGVDSRQQLVVMPDLDVAYDIVNNKIWHRELGLYVAWQKRHAEKLLKDLGRAAGLELYEVKGPWTSEKVEL